MCHLHISRKQRSSQPELNNKNDTNEHSKLHIRTVKKKEHLGTHTSESKNGRKKKTAYMIQSNSKKRANTESRFGRPCVLNSVKTL